MPEPIAFANGNSQISCTDGAQGTLCAVDPPRWNWDVSTIQQTAATSNNKVFAEGKLVAIEGDSMASHPDGVPCVPAPVNHAPSTSLCAAKVKISGKHAVRVGSKFNTGTPFDHTVSSGSEKVFIGGPSISV
jgi:uncharacterized Zn-binding protein involved in type VI secretion